MRRGRCANLFWNMCVCQIKSFKVVLCWSCGSFATGKQRSTCKKQSRTRTTLDIYIHAGKAKGHGGSIRTCLQNERPRWGTGNCATGMLVWEELGKQNNNSGFRLQSEHQQQGTHYYCFQSSSQTESLGPSQGRPQMSFWSLGPSQERPDKYVLMEQRNVQRGLRPRDKIIFWTISAIVDKTHVGQGSGERKRQTPLQLFLCFETTRIHQSGCPVTPVKKIPGLWQSQNNCFWQLQTKEEKSLKRWPSRPSCSTCFRVGFFPQNSLARVPDYNYVWFNLWVGQKDTIALMHRWTKDF